MSAFPSKEEKEREDSALGDVQAAIEALIEALKMTRHGGAISAIGHALKDARAAQAMLQDDRDRRLG